MAISTSAKLCKLNDYVNSLRRTEEQEIRKCVDIQVEEAKAQSQALMEIHNQRSKRLQILQAQRKEKIEFYMVFTRLMGKRDLTLHQGWEDNAMLWKI